MGTKEYFKGKHALITGGSEGIGLEIAKQLSHAGCKVSICSRSPAKLQAAKQAIEACSVEPQVRTYPLDVTDEKHVQRGFASCRDAMGSIDVLICCAGAAECGYFHQQDSSVFQRMMQLNYMGTLHAIKAVYTDMVQGNAGHICLISSAMSLTGFTGYSAYAPSKFAVRGLGECLRNELKGTSVQVSIAFPPDVDTPGYKLENMGKPPETAKMSEGTLYPPDTVAKVILKGMAAGQYVLDNPVFKVGLLQTVCAGLIPRQWLALPWEMLVGWASPIICWVVAAEHDSIATQGAPKRFGDLWSASRQQEQQKQEQH